MTHFLVIAISYICLGEKSVFCISRSHLVMQKMCHLFALGYLSTSVLGCSIPCSCLWSFLCHSTRWYIHTLSCHKLLNTKFFHEKLKKPKKTNEQTNKDIYIHKKISNYPFPSICSQASNIPCMHILGFFSPKFPLNLLKSSFLSTLMKLIWI